MTWPFSALATEARAPEIASAATADAIIVLIFIDYLFWLGCCFWRPYGRAGWKSVAGRPQPQAPQGGEAANDHPGALAFSLDDRRFAAGVVGEQAAEEGAFLGGGVRLVR